MRYKIIVPSKEETMTTIELMHEDIFDIFLRLKSVIPDLVIISEKQEKLLSLIRKHTPGSSKEQRHELEAFWSVSKAFNSITQEIMKGEDSVLVERIFTDNGQFWSTPNSAEKVLDRLTGMKLRIYMILRELQLEPFFVRVPQKLSQRRPYEYEMRIKIPGT